MSNLCQETSLLPWLICELRFPLVRTNSSFIKLKPAPSPLPAQLTKDKATASTTEGSVLLKMGRVCYFLPRQSSYMLLEGQTLYNTLEISLSP